MTLKQFYQQHDNKMIIVYIKDDELRNLLKAFETLQRR